GQEFADTVIAQVKKAGYINKVQNYFGLHYRADMMPEANEKFLELMEQSGFSWFRKHDHYGDDSSPH
ncbi:MAG: hypothetical protein V3T31_11125, partial [candidate division Zixibacteria bacterium]